MRVVVAMEVEALWSKLPKENGLEFAFCQPRVEAIEETLTPETEVLVTDAMPGRLERCGGLKWIHLLSAGTNQLFGHPLMERELLLSNSAGICAVHMAEYAVGQLIRHIKRFDAMNDLQTRRTWPADRLAWSNPSLRGRKALIAGYGGVGRETARLLKAFGMSVTAVQSGAERQSYRGFVPYAGIGDPDGSLPDRVITTAELKEALAEADAVIVTLPLTKETRHLFDAPLFAAMKKEAVLIHVSRGAVVHTTDLLQALTAGQLAHAYLDVFEQEPLPADAPEWIHPGVTATPHLSGVMPDAMAVQENLFLDNLRRYRAGRILFNQLDRQKFRQELQ